MKGIVARSLGLGVVLAATAVSLVAGEAPKAKTSGIPLVTDWTHQHVVFSQPRTPEQAARVQKEIRFLQQEQRRNGRQSLSTKIDPSMRRRFRRYRHRYGHHLHRDWSWDIGPGATVGEAHFPAKYSFSSSVANCGLAPLPDFVVFNTSVPSVAGPGGQASIMALTNLYSGCSGVGPVPGSFWAYDTGGTVATSSVLSFDGSQIAFTQTSGGTASLVILKWSAFDGQVDSPTSLTALDPTLYFGCTAPCMTTLPLHSADTMSSVYYDYGSDTAFVGDDGGTLHQFSGVFKGTPAEVTGGGWPAALGASVLTSPVFVSGTTFIADKGGFVYQVNSSGGVTKSGQMDFGTGFVESPIVDSSMGVVYAFSSNDGATPTASAGVFQLPFAFGAGAIGTEAPVGAATAAGTGTTPLYDGGFDENYLFSSNSTGNIFVCGNPGGNPTLYAVSVSGGTVTGSKAGPVLSSTGTTKCSPVTHVYNPNVTGLGLPEEWVFASVQGAGTPSGCAGVACVMNFRVTSWQPNTLYNAGQLVLDPNMNIQVVDISGRTSGATAPTWNATLFGPTLDPDINGVRWRNQGALTGPGPANWPGATQTIGGGLEIVDSHNNIEIAELGGGTTGSTQPTWPTAEGAETADGSVTWYNLGPNPVSGLSESGGTSGIIIDNTASLAGASQVYFTTLQDFSCEFGATGGCAVQASQQGLQ